MAHSGLAWLPSLVGFSHAAVDRLRCLPFCGSVACGVPTYVYSGSCCAELHFAAFHACHTGCSNRQLFLVPHLYLGSVLLHPRSCSVGRVHLDWALGTQML
jgi:hypothetical protein